MLWERVTGIVRRAVQNVAASEHTVKNVYRAADMSHTKMLKQHARNAVVAAAATKRAYNTIIRYLRPR